MRRYFELVWSNVSKLSTVSAIKFIDPRDASSAYRGTQVASTRALASLSRLARTPRFCYISRMPTRIRTLNVVLLLAVAAYAQNQPVAIRAGTLLDGKGGVQHNVEIVVEGGKIQKIGPASGKASYDFRAGTVLPGMIDTHVHIAWHFGPDGRYQPRDTSQTAAMGYAVENAYVTLMGGFTTVQSVGSPIDGDLRAAINRGVLPGPRVLTSLRAIN